MTINNLFLKKIKKDLQNRRVWYIIKSSTKDKNKSIFPMVLRKMAGRKGGRFHQKCKLSLIF